MREYAEEKMMQKLETRKQNGLVSENSSVKKAFSIFLMLMADAACFFFFSNTCGFFSCFARCPQLLFSLIRILMGQYQWVCVEFCGGWFQSVVELCIRLRHSASTNRCYSPFFRLSVFRFCYFFFCLFFLFFSLSVDKMGEEHCITIGWCLGYPI